MITKNSNQSFLTILAIVGALQLFSAGAWAEQSSIPSEQGPVDGEEVVPGEPIQCFTWFIDGVFIGCLMHPASNPLPGGGEPVDPIPYQLDSGSAAILPPFPPGSEDHSFMHGFTEAQCRAACGGLAIDQITPQPPEEEPTPSPGSGRIGGGPGFPGPNPPPPATPSPTPTPEWEKQPEPPVPDPVCGDPDESKVHPSCCVIFGSQGQSLGDSYKIKKSFECKKSQIGSQGKKTRLRIFIEDDFDQSLPVHYSGIHFVARGALNEEIELNAMRHKGSNLLPKKNDIPWRSYDEFKFKVNQISVTYPTRNPQSSLNVLDYPIVKKGTAFTLLLDNSRFNAAKDLEDLFHGEVYLSSSPKTQPTILPVKFNIFGDPSQLNGISSLIASLPTQFQNTLKFIRNAAPPHTPLGLKAQVATETFTTPPGFTFPEPCNKHKRFDSDCDAFYQNSDGGSDDYVPSFLSWSFIPPSVQLLGFAISVPGAASPRSVSRWSWVFIDLAKFAQPDGTFTLPNGSADDLAISAMLDTVAHELGHYLGLFHTDQHDLPEASFPHDNQQWQNNTNIMRVPVPPPTAMRELHPAQIDVIRYHPLTNFGAQLVE